MKTATTLKIGATVKGGITVFAEFESEEAAEAAAAEFPKGLRVRGLGLTPGNRGCIHLYIRLAADGVNGGRNETGIKRYRGIRRAIGSHFCWGAEWTMSYSNSLTEEEFEAYIA